MYSCHRDPAVSVLITLLAVRIQEVKFLQISQAASKHTASRFKHIAADTILLFLVRPSRAPGQKKVRIVSGFSTRPLDPDALSLRFATLGHDIDSARVS
jgi:hypothetical protein